MKSLARVLLTVVGATLMATAPVRADTGEHRFGVGLYARDKERNDATYRPLAAWLPRLAVVLRAHFEAHGPTERDSERQIAADM